MSWIFSKALCASLPCSQALVVEYSQGKCSDGEPSAQLSVMPTQQQFWRNDKMMDCSIFSRFGLTYRLLTESRGEELLMSYLAGFHAKTSAQQEAAQESMGPDQECGERWRGSFAKYDRDLSLWKTPQLSLLGDWEEFSETWPRSGTMRNGECFLRSPLVRSMKESASGLLPTPTAHNSKEGDYSSERDRNTPTLATHAGGKINPEWTEHLMGFPGKWTDLRPSATDRCHNARQKRSDS